MPEVYIKNAPSQEAKSHVEIGGKTTIVCETNSDLGQELNRRPDHIKDERKKIKGLLNNNQKQNVGSINSCGENVYYGRQVIGISKQIGEGTNQIGAVNGQMSTCNSLTGAVCDHIGIVNGQTGVMKDQTDAVNGHSSAVNGQIGVVDGQTGTVNGQTGAVNGKTVVVNGQTGLQNDPPGTFNRKTAAGNVKTVVEDGQMGDKSKDAHKIESSGFLQKISMFLRRKRKQVKSIEEEEIASSHSIDETITE